MTVHHGQTQQFVLKPKYYQTQKVYTGQQASEGSLPLSVAPIQGAVMLAGAMLPTVWGTTAVTTLAAAMLAAVEGTLAVAMLAAMLTPLDMQLETAPPSWAVEKDSLLTFRNGYPSLSLVLGLAAVSLPFGEGT
ncbi:UNVERIFIED_CONTAM: hypothetical protein FKN15_077351 [Acipenser sinensis]